AGDTTHLAWVDGDPLEGHELNCAGGRKRQLGRIRRRVGMRHEPDPRPDHRSPADRAADREPHDVPLRPPGQGRRGHAEDPGGV
ncbi:MAG: hypothetical protein AVDCRST_MAG76-170, partial [uncultured Acidimicrobiales bacterium]